MIGESPIGFAPIAGAGSNLYKILIAAVMHTTGNIKKKSTKKISSNLHLSGIIKKRISKTLHGIISTTTPLIKKRISKTLHHAGYLTGHILKITGKKIFKDMSVTPSIKKGITRSVQGIIHSTPLIKKGISKSVFTGMELTGLVLKSLQKIIHVDIVLSGSVKKRISKLFQSIITLQGNIIIGGKSWKNISQIWIKGNGIFNVQFIKSISINTNLVKAQQVVINILKSQKITSQNIK